MALGVDVGSVTTKIAVTDSSDKVVASCYLRTGGDPIRAVQEALKMVHKQLPANTTITAAGATGSARELASLLVGADATTNEITCHAVAAAIEVPDVSTVLEIGGQDSKIIVLRGGVAVDFAMNTVCAAGTGSFLDHQAARLGVAIEDFGDHALRAKTPVRVAGRCTVFAESDMIHKQQMGHTKESIIAGLCQALVRNYLNNVGKGKDIRPPVVFQGGVAANKGIRAAFEEALDMEVLVPENHLIMGSIGAACLGREEIAERAGGNCQTSFKGFDAISVQHETRSFECDKCPNECEVVELLADGEKLAAWGSRCGRYQTGKAEKPEVAARGA
jgi:predicted CoA-substrate-specific enzyme activase